ncbi:exodeoxyribonuclease-3 [Allopseudospirillum japonicum]|uniref:Exodeoxyribonuclease-3 n=1 Tax=Allopseudospirillum japonicum TaxID=64971 RepID=A0A1H6SID7_9GAMM|nr:exodeoxyribonuclease III [Allopseudospirillum japonicum]SEI63780.1 exodeoxyribonuclease-3 [Allopseudospirillum japonicum]
MKVICFNINGIRARLHQIEYLIQTHQPDVIALQETKVHDEAFPIEAIHALGYQAYYHGQKAHYGVAFLSKLPPHQLTKGFSQDTPEAQKRLIIGEWLTDQGKITLINGYFPQGENIKHETKFPAKRQFYANLQNLLQTDYHPQDLLLVMGDFNIAITDADIGIGEENKKRWLRTGKTSFQPEERAWMHQLLSWGLTDTFRHLYPESRDLSWFDYRSRGFDAEPKRGLRIDTFLASQPVLDLCTQVTIDYQARGMEKPSDHCPVITEVNLKLR